MVSVAFAGFIERLFAGLSVDASRRSLNDRQGPFAIAGWSRRGGGAGSKIVSLGWGKPPPGILWRVLSPYLSWVASRLQSQ
jgi:hypothetical protein